YWLARLSAMPASYARELWKAGRRSNFPRYTPTGTRALRAVTENPEKSDRAIAGEIGVGKDTVRRARTGAHAPVGKRVGKDGKVSQAPKPRRDRLSDYCPAVGKWRAGA